MIAEQALTLPSEEGAVLEARLAVPLGAAAGIAVCHPHPLYGGDMDNPVVVRTVEVCADLGLATVRFNFRGVGASTGTHGGGRAEEADVEAALHALRAALDPGPAIALAGYSFGAAVAAQVVGRSPGSVAGLALIAPPVAFMGEAPFVRLATVTLPLLVVAGNQDEYCPAPALDAIRQRLPQATVHVIDGANHFFFGKLFALGEAVAGWARRLLPREAGGRRGTG